MCPGRETLAETGKAGQSKSSSTTKPFNLGVKDASFLFLRSLSLSVESATLLLYQSKPTYSLLSSQKNFLRNTGFLYFLLSCQSLMYSSSSPRDGLSSRVLNKRSQTSQALENVLLVTLAFKFLTTDIFSFVTTPSHHETLTTRLKRSRQRKQAS